jgi:xanthine/CO dehydrogenase XdhC/CoxF family maturation factor
VVNLVKETDVGPLAALVKAWAPASRSPAATMLFNRNSIYCGA